MQAKVADHDITAAHLQEERRESETSGAGGMTLSWRADRQSANSRQGSLTSDLASSAEFATL